MKRKFQKNREGSVLLAVVCMTMVCMTLVTIALSTVNYTTKASSRNVQKTQAKITAEACLTEFINSYTPDVDGDGEPDPDKTDYSDLQALATGHNSSNPNIVTVTANGDPNFNQNYGETRLLIYTEDSGFRVKAETTYGSQTQTASVYFGAVVNAPYTPTDTLESSNGNTYRDGAATPVDGDIYLEKPTGYDPTKEPKDYITIGSNTGYFYSHIYSEYSLFLNSGSKMKDVTNKTYTNNYMPNQTKPAGDGVSKYFQQAPTIITDGYLTMDNGCSISSDVGKTKIPVNSAGTSDELRVNKDDIPLSDYNDETKYEYTNLDGFIQVDKKWIQASSSSCDFNLGTPDSKIDLYTHGMYIAGIPSEIDGVANGEKYVIQEVYPDKSFGGDGASQPQTFYGNVYCYEGTSGTSAALYQDGNLYFCSDQGKTITVDGDLFVEGDIYLATGSNLGQEAKLNINGTLYLAGEIHLCTYSGGKMTTIETAKVVGDGLKAYDTDGNELPKTAGISGGSTSRILNYVFPNSETKFSSNINKSGRNEFPVAGYRPSTATKNTTRTHLSEIYGEASSNKIFNASLNPSSTMEEKNAAKDLGKKYAQALVRPYKANKVIRYQTKTGVTNNLYEENYADMSNVILVNASMSFKHDDLHSGKKFLVRLTDEDIVIALPAEILSGDVSVVSRFRIDTTHADAGVYCYFMYYDESQAIPEDQLAANVDCLYLSEEDENVEERSVTVSRYKESGSYENVTITFKPMSEESRSGHGVVGFDAGGSDNTFIADSYLFYFVGKSVSAMDVVNTASKNAFNNFGSRNWTFWGADGKPTDYNDENDPMLSMKYDGYGGYVSHVNNIMVVVPDNVNFKNGDNSEIQCILFAPKSDCEFSGSGTRVYGQVKCGKVTLANDDKGGFLRNIPPANGSILGYVSLKNGSTSYIDIQYYQY